MSTDEIVLRPANEADRKALVEFNQAMARETEGKDLAPEILSAGVAAVLMDPRHGFYVVAEIAGQVAGALMVTYEWSDWRNGVFWWIQSVYVKPEHRRRGIYRRLYEYIKRLAAEARDVCGFRLYVERENAAAQEAYAALGMRETHYKMFEEARGKAEGMSH